MIALAGIVLGTLVACEIALRLPLGRVLATLRHMPAKAARVVGSARISDTWKEKVLPAYAGRILRASLLLLACLLAIAAPVVLAAALTSGGLAAGAASLMQPAPLVLMIGVGAAYVWLRHRSTMG